MSEETIKSLDFLYMLNGRMKIPPDDAGIHQLLIRGEHIDQGTFSSAASFPLNEIRSVCNEIGFKCEHFVLDLTFLKTWELGRGEAYAGRIASHMLKEEYRELCTRIETIKAGHLQKEFLPEQEESPPMCRFSCEIL